MQASASLAEKGESYRKDTTENTGKNDSNGRIRRERLKVVSVGEAKTKRPELSGTKRIPDGKLDQFRAAPESKVFHHAVLVKGHRSRSDV